MKIKVAILEKDKIYLSRIVSAFGVKYADELGMYSFTDADVAIETVKKDKIDVLLANEAFDIDFNRLPHFCAFAYLVDTAGVDTLNDQRVICKFQKADQIYKAIVNAYAEVSKYIMPTPGGVVPVIAFTSPAGGVGTSTVAASCALHFARAGKKALYLNLETFGSADLFFTGEGMYDLSDLIFAVKSKKPNLYLKVEGCVKRDARGVDFFSQPKNVLHRLELNEEEIGRLLQAIQASGKYDVIVLDIDFSLQPKALDIYSKVQAIVMVSDGSPAGNLKTRRAFEAVAILEDSRELPLTPRMGVIYNRFSSKRGEMAAIDSLRVIGGIPVYVGGTTEQIMDQVAGMNMFDKIL